LTNPLTKKKRRTKRIAKFSNLKRYNFSPTNLLKPIVHNPTISHNLKIRLGRGFSLEEVNRSNVSRKLAFSLGISLDKRRRGNNSRKISNIKRLNDFYEKLKLEIPSKKNTEHSKPEQSLNINFAQIKIKKKFFDDNCSDPKHRNRVVDGSLKGFEFLRSPNSN